MSTTGSAIAHAQRSGRSRRSLRIDRRRRHAGRARYPARQSGDGVFRSRVSRRPALDSRRRHPVLTFMAEEVTPYWDAEHSRYVAYCPLLAARPAPQHRPSPARPIFTGGLCPVPYCFPPICEDLNVDYYTNCHSLYPGTSDVHLVFRQSLPARAGRLCLDLHLAVSLDGEAFDFVPWRPGGSRRCHRLGPRCRITFGRVSSRQTTWSNSTRITWASSSGGTTFPHKWPRTIAVATHSPVGVVGERTIGRVEGRRAGRADHLRFHAASPHDLSQRDHGAGRVAAGSRAG